MATNNSKNEPTDTSGKVLQGQGVGTTSAFSTATYPSTATSTGVILRADGTNWVATTATYPTTAGSAGNALTSDGTNFNSTAYKGYSLYLQTDTQSPSDSTTFYWGQSAAFADITTAGTSRTKLYIPQAGTITSCFGGVTVQGTLGSNENCTVGIRLNDTSNTNVTTSLQLTAASNAFSNSGLSIAVAAGDFIEFFVTTPAWVTNPTTCSASITCTIR